MSSLFGRTLREAPAEAETASHQLLLRAGLVRQVAAGVYSHLPLGQRVMRKIIDIIREEMDAIDGQQVIMPILNPAELWQESGRWYAVGPELIRFQDRAERDLVLAMTHEEVVTDLARREVHSYRQLPFMLYQIHTKIRDEPRPRGGLVRLREFIMKDGYSFHPDSADLDAYYPRMYRAYENIFRRCGLDVIPVEADPGMIGGTGSHEFIMLTETGEDTIIVCPNCHYAANRNIAVGKKPAAAGSQDDGAAAPSLVHTPNVKTIDDLARFFQLPHSHFLKTVMYEADGGLVAAVIRGDLDVNEAKLAKTTKATNLALAGDEKLRQAGVVPGFLSPVGMNGVRVVVDDSVSDGSYVAGANQPDYHLRNVRPSRDFAVAQSADIAVTQAGHLCARCDDPLKEAKGIELGHTFKLGTKYTEAMKATYLDARGQQKLILMGCYGIGVDRLMASIVEQRHDQRGIVWPVRVAPYHFYLCLLADDAESKAGCDRFYDQMKAAGLEALYDDRDATAGVKFNDADLIGLPWRVTYSRRSLAAGGVEVKARGEKASAIVPLDEAVPTFQRYLSDALANTTFQPA